MALPAVVDDDEPLVSYVLENSKFKADGIDHRQLMPSNRYGNTSVFRREGLGEEETAALGHKESTDAGTPPLLGEIEETRLDLREETWRDKSVAPHIWPTRNGCEAGIGPLVYVVI